MTRKNMISEVEETPLIENRNDEGEEYFENDWECGLIEDNGKDCNKNVVIETAKKFQNGKLMKKSVEFNGTTQTTYISSYWLILAKKKRVVGVIVALLVLCILNTSLIGSSSEARIPVLHHSHVPGMKDDNYTLCQWITNTSDRAVASSNISSDLKATIKSTDKALLNNEIVKKILVQTSKLNNTYENSTSSTTSPLLPTGYLVWSERCKMPNIDPYLPEVMEFFKREKYESCSNMKPLTKLDFNKTSQRYVIQIIDERRSEYTKSGGGLDCCYQSIERNSTGKKADKEVSLSACLSFRKKVQLAPTIDNVLVKCKSKGKQVYINGYPMMPMRHKIQERLNFWKHNATKKATSVLLIGIDSISRLNLIRAMPKTAQYLYDNEWFEMSGYNKIEDNTFPNLMALLTGFNQTTAFRRCSPRAVGGLDNCPFIWRTFKKYGYVTAYAEDETTINTFNYLKLGFTKLPVDYYLRPFLLSAEKNLPTKLKTNLFFCLGYKHSADYVYDYALELATRYKEYPFFGLFWANTFSHNAISDCSSMDDKMVDYLHKFSDRGILSKSIVIFFSDHGMRFGPTRKTLSGHFEERLPFLFIWLPPHLKISNPDFVSALSVNKNRLTNPYDIHMTLKHILEMSGRGEEKDFTLAKDCPNCQTLLRPVPHNRSCEDIAIEDHWCTCIPYQSVYKNSPTIKKLAKATVSYINNYVADYKNGSVRNLCVKLSLSDIQNAYRALRTFVDSSAGGQVETYRIIFNTNPNKALFEATIRYNHNTEDLKITGEISRLNMYASDSHCIQDGGAKKYCSCKKKKGW